MRRLAAICVIGLASVACGSLHLERTAAAPAAVPWAPLPFKPPSPLPSPSSVVPPGTRDCRAADLHANAGGTSGAGGRIYKGIMFTNTSARRCLLSGVPPAALLDGSGHVIAMRSVVDPPFGLQPAVLEPGATEAGIVVVSWPSRDDFGCSTHAVPIAQIQLGFPDGVLKVPAGIAPTGVPFAVVPCSGPLGVTPFQVKPQPAPSPSPPKFVIKLSAPSSVSAGKTLEYTVTLTVGAPGAVDFPQDCPNYEEELFPVGGGTPLGGKHIYSLNCAPVGAVRPGASVTFQMLLLVPADAPHGVYNLMWRVADADAISEYAQTPVHVG